MLLSLLIFLNSKTPPLPPIIHWAKSYCYITCSASFQSQTQNLLIVALLLSLTREAI